MSPRCRRASWRSSATSSASKRGRRPRAQPRRGGASPINGSEAERRRAPARMGARRVTRLAAALLAPALACAVPAPWPAGPSATEQAYREALAVAESDPDGAEARLEAFLRQWPESARADDAALELARLRVERGEAGGAARVLRESLVAHPKGDRADAARLLLARIERDAGRSDEAYRVASAIRPSRLPPHERAEAYGLLAGVAAARSDRTGQLRWLGQLAAEARSEVEREAALREIDGVLAQLDTAQLAALAQHLGSAPPAARVHLGAAERALDAGDVDAAERALAALAAASPEPETAARAEALAARAHARRGLGPEPGELPAFGELAPLAQPATAGASGTLGVVLPLSGPFARFGEASLRGVMLAAGVFDGDGSAVRLLVRDSRGVPDVAAAAVAELAADPDVRAIVGPLLSEPAEAAARVAEQAGVPLIALTPREGVAAGSGYVFRLALTPRSEVAALADYAVRELHVGSVAILHPRDPYGRGLKDLFWDAMEERGVRIAGVASYEPDATDFAEPIRRLVGYLLLDDGEQAALRRRERILGRAKRLSPQQAVRVREEAAKITGPHGEALPPIVDFDALFIADGHESAELIAPQLAFHEVGPLPLLGPSGWNHPDLLAIGGRHVEGAVFAESFFAESRFAFVMDFRDRHRAVFALEPDVLAAQAFDAANLVLVQLARGLTSRSEVREGLLAVRAYPGVSGVTSVLPDGNARKRPFLLGVRGGHIVSLD